MRLMKKKQTQSTIKGNQKMTSKEALKRIKDDIEIGYLSTKHDNQKDKENYLVMLKIIKKSLKAQLKELEK